MKKIFTLLLLAASFTTAYSTIWNVDVGGGPSPLPSPYYAPQNMTIQQGDTVLWTWSSGQHNVTSTSGPASFSSADMVAPATFQFVFTLPGVYNYECTLFNHSNTQFGSITVEAILGTAPSAIETVEAGPNPLQDLLRVNASAFEGEVTARVYEVATGRLVRQANRQIGHFSIPVADLPRGIYLLELSDGDRRETKVLSKN